MKRKASSGVSWTEIAVALFVVMAIILMPAATQATSTMNGSRSSDVTTTMLQAPTAGPSPQTGSIWQTLAADESAHCLSNTTSYYTAQKGNFSYSDTMLSHSPTLAACTNSANYGAVSVLLSNTTGAILSVLLEDFVDTSGNLTFQSMDAYYIPIFGTAINSMVEFDISCPHPSQGCSVTQIGAGGSPASTQGALSGCTLSASWGTGWIGSAFSMNQCATIAVVGTIMFIGAVVALVGGIASGGPGAIIGGVILVGGAYLGMIDGWGGGAGDWFALGITNSCHWSWWSYSCVTIVTGFSFAWYNPVWTPWY